MCTGKFLGYSIAMTLYPPFPPSRPRGRMTVGLLLPIYAYSPAGLRPPRQTCLLAQPGKHVRAARPQPFSPPKALTGGWHVVHVRYMSSSHLTQLLKGQLQQVGQALLRLWRGRGRGVYRRWKKNKKKNERTRTTQTPAPVRQWL